MPRIAVIANCQARPMEALCRGFLPDAEITGIGIVHLVTPADEGGILAACEAADLILAQLVQDSFPVPFVRTSALKTAFGDKVLSWPNLFFRGQCPDLYYATGPNRRRLLGPLGEYHLKTVLDAWRDGASVQEARRRFEEEGSADWLKVAETSLQDLRRREAQADVPASDLIETSWVEQRLFFTFNHPRAILLRAFAQRLLKAAGLQPSGPGPERFGEPLGPIVPPTTPAMRRSLGLRFPDAEEAIRGPSYPEISGRPRPYTLQELLDAFYRAYDEQAEVARSARLS